MSTQAVEKVPDLMARIAPVSDQAAAMAVVDNDSLQSAGEFLTKVLIPIEKEIGETFDPLVEDAHALHKKLCATRAKHLAPVTEAKTRIKGLIGSYQLEQQRLADLEAKRIREEEERRAREQREAEIRQAEELAARQREAEAQAQREAEERREREIDEAEAMGAPQELIDELSAAPLVVNPVQVGPTAEEVAAIAAAPVLRTVSAPPPAPAKVAGVSVSVDYVPEVVNLSLLIAFVAKEMRRNPALVNLLSPNMAALNAKARTEKELMRVDGVQVVKRPRVAGRGR